MVFALGAALSLGVMLHAAQGAAQAATDEGRDAEAKAIFQAGASAFESGRYETALARWQEAYRLSGRPALQYNIGLAYDRLRRDLDALKAFRAYLTWDSKGERAVEVRGRIDAIERSLSRGSSGWTAATPAQAAATVAGDGRRAPLRSEPRESSLARSGWFWSGIGVLAAGVVAGVLLAMRGGEKVQRSAPVVPSTGLVYMGLRIDTPSTVGER